MSAEDDEFEDLNLDEILARLMEEQSERAGSRSISALVASQRDVPLLIAEVVRLRAIRASLRSNIGHIERLRPLRAS